MDDPLLNDVMNGVFLTEWSDDNYRYFFNVVLTGEEKYGDYSLAMTKTPHGGRKVGVLAEVSKELLSDSNFMAFARSETERIKYPIG
jgi:hypothetical protein